MVWQKIWERGVYERAKVCVQKWFDHIERMALESVCVKSGVNKEKENRGRVGRMI